MPFSRRSLDLDAPAECERIAGFLRRGVHQAMRRNGAVVGISGGVDSSVVLALCVKAFGAGRVAAIMMPEQDSDPESERLARLAAAAYGVDPIRHEISSVLEGFGCYRLRDEAIRRLFPEYNPAVGYKVKLVLPPDPLDTETLNVFSLALESPTGESISRPVPPAEFRQIVAASNFKQRTRMSILYYYAELRHFAVVGTANRDEHEQGFFVKHGDGGVDIRPLVHLYKMQIYQLARELGVPEEIRHRPPTSDTYTAACTQQEFFFRLPFEVMDLLAYARDRGIPAAEVAEAMQLTQEQVQRGFADLERKARATTYLRMAAMQLKPDGEQVGASQA